MTTYDPLAQLDAFVRSVHGGATFYLPECGAPTAPEIVEQIDRLLAEPEPQPAPDAEREKRIKEMAERINALSQTAPPRGSIDGGDVRKLVPIHVLNEMFALMRSAPVEPASKLPIAANQLARAVRRVAEFHEDVEGECADAWEDVANGLDGVEECLCGMHPVEPKAEKSRWPTARRTA